MGMGKFPGPKEIDQRNQNHGNGKLIWLGLKARNMTARGQAPGACAQQIIHRAESAGQAFIRNGHYFP
jgi:hypothetical protein